MNILPKHNEEAEDLLSKAVKLDPKLVNAWNELGECYWKKDKMMEAATCFKRALSNVINCFFYVANTSTFLKFFVAKK